MQPATVEAVCPVCGAQAIIEAPKEYGRDLLQWTCTRCDAPYLLTLTADARRVESVLLTMYPFPMNDVYRCSPVQILCEIASTSEELARVRDELHGVDVPALVERTRAVQLAGLDHCFLSDAEIREIAPMVVASAERMLRDAASGLLGWRIDQLCRTACAANEARARDQRRTPETAR